MSTKKTVEFAYPTSTQARRFGYAATGCWTVELLKNGHRPKAQSGHATRQEALTQARKLPYCWSWIFAAQHPTDAQP